MSQRNVFLFDGARVKGDFLEIRTEEVQLTLNYPRSWLARRFWCWLGFEWQRFPK